MGERIKVTANKPLSTKENSASNKQKTGFRSQSSHVDQILFLQRTIGNQAVQRLIKSGALQAKLRIGQPGDVYEQEADRVADEVMRMPEPEMQRQVEPEEEEEEILQTKPLVDQITPLVQRQVEEEEEEEMLQAKSREDGTSEVTNDLESQINAIKGGGRPLAESERAYFEPRFGVDFSRVRVHTGVQADESARAVNAQAYTIENNIVFGDGQYNPKTNSGKSLLAHELTHVVQQTGVSRSLRGKLIIGQPRDVDRKNVNVKDKDSTSTMALLASQSFVIQRHPPPGNNDEAQGTSFYSDPQPSSDGLVARIYFPTLETELDTQDLEVLIRVRNHYQTLLMGNRIHFEIIGTADWRPADNERLARERARSVMEYLESHLGERARNYSCSWYGVGTIGTPDSGSTAEELNEFRRVDIITMFRPPVREPEPELEPEPPEPVHSTRFKARVVGSTGGGIVIGAGYGGLEIVDITNHRRRYYRYAGLGVSVGLSGASGISDWQEFTTTAPMRVEDFSGPVFHTAGGAALGHGPMIETFRLIAPVIYGADSVLLEFSGFWEEGWALGAGVDLGPIDPITDVDRVSEDYD